MAVITPDTFNPLRLYIGARLQQGVPLVDADWNEAHDVHKFEVQAFLKWFVGNGVPDGNDGFRIEGLVPAVVRDFVIRRGVSAAPDGTNNVQRGLRHVGRCLVDGMDVLIAEDINFRAQPLHVSRGEDATELATTLGVPTIAEVPNVTGTVVVYLDVWERLVTPVEDPSLVHSGLGVESCARLKREWVVRARVGDSVPVPGDADFIADPPHSYYALATIAHQAGMPIADQIMDRRQTGLSLSTLHDEVARLESAKVNRTGDRMTGGLRVQQGVGDPVAAIEASSTVDTGSNIGLSSVVGGSHDSFVKAGVLAQADGSGQKFGVFGEARGTGTNYGVYGFAAGSTGTTNYGVYGDIAPLPAEGATHWAGYFRGNVHVTGRLEKSTGSFLIDHPLDPENKLLRHNFVESPENLCMYRGKVRLDQNGTASVSMPDYFTALTKAQEATVLLTPIGEKPFLVSYAWQDSYRQVRIHGEPGAEVSYLVLADRDDPAMRLLGRPVEEEKGVAGFEKGQYLNPEAFGLVPTRAADPRAQLEAIRARDAAIEPQNTEGAQTEES